MGTGGGVVLELVLLLEELEDDPPKMLYATTATIAANSRRPLPELLLPCVVEVDLRYEVEDEVTVLVVPPEEDDVVLDV